MPIKTIFVDDDSNEMDFYINQGGNLFLTVGKPEDEGMYSGIITLNKEDVILLINKLVELEKEMGA